MSCQKRYEVKQRDKNRIRQQKKDMKNFDGNFKDVTLADYANSDIVKGRLGKGKVSFSVNHEVKHMNTDDKGWEEKLEEFEGEFDFVSEQDECGKEVLVMKKATRHKKQLGGSITDSRNGNSYHVDIWHMIAKYIRPEDTATFSCICRDTWSVVNSPVYWFNMYKRYYRDVPSLPARLRPECMVRHHALKACVVRALFYMYPPLASRVKTSNGPYNLCSQQCIAVWQQKLSNNWKLCLKMRPKDCQRNNPTNDLMAILEDIFANPEEGCSVLQFVSAENTMFPAVMGLTLQSIKMSMEVTHTNMRVQLVFGSGRICNGHLDSTGTVALSLNTVQNVRVLNWWDPQYPYSYQTIIREKNT